MTIKVNATTLRMDFARVRAAIASAPKHLRDEMESKAVQGLATNIFVRPLREKTPKRTGKLRRSIRARTRKDRDGVDVIYGRRTKDRARSTFYGRFLEFGYEQVAWGRRTGRRNDKYKNLARWQVYRNRDKLAARLEVLLNKKLYREITVKRKGGWERRI